MDFGVSLYYFVVIILKVLVILLLFGLLKIYIDSYKKIKIGYTLGLILFVFIFLFKTISSLIFTLSGLFIVEDLMSFNISRHEFISSFIELIAIGVLYKITKDS